MLLTRQTWYHSSALHKQNSELQSEVTYPNFSYPNGFSKTTPTIPATSVNVKLALAVQMGDIECFRARSTHFMATEGTR